MRMWMVDPRILCRKHLLGEHVETHMFKGHIERKKGIKGYIWKNCVEVKSITQRHADLVTEMIRRGYKHNSDLESVSIEHLSLTDREYIINRTSSQLELLRRCPDCFLTQPRRNPLPLGGDEYEKIVANRPKL